MPDSALLTVAVADFSMLEIKSLKDFVSNTTRKRINPRGCFVINLPSVPSPSTLQMGSACANAKLAFVSAPRTAAKTHSAPARVLPNPRPASSTQVRQSPSGGSCPACAHSGKGTCHRAELVFGERAEQPIPQRGRGAVEDFGDG